MAENKDALEMKLEYEISLLPLEYLQRGYAYGRGTPEAFGIMGEPKTYRAIEHDCLKNLKSV